MILFIFLVGFRSFRVLSLLGVGTYGQVVKCQDIRTKEYVAIKVIKNLPAYHRQAMIEFEVLKLIAKKKNDDLISEIDLYNGKDHLIQFQDFLFRNHLCFVFPLLQCNLYEYLKLNEYKGLCISKVRDLLYQLVIAIRVIHQNGVIHCDIKPENILIKDYHQVNNTLKCHNKNINNLILIDFGSACFTKHVSYPYIQSRFYRSPEVLLGCNEYDFSIDIWSLACVALEMYLGLPLFPDKMNIINFVDI